MNKRFSNFIKKKRETKKIDENLSFLVNRRIYKKKRNWKTKKKKKKKKEKNRWKKLIKGKFQDAIEIRQR